MTTRTETPRHRKLHQDAHQALKTARDIRFTLGALEALAIVGHVQLALRHPANTGETAKIARKFIEVVRSNLPEGARPLLDSGFNPEFDVDRDPPL